MHVRVVAPLNINNLTTIQPTFRALPPEQWTTHASLTDPLYVPESWVPLQNARNNFSEALGGPEGFDRWATDWMIINPSEAYGTHNSPDKIWAKFGAAADVSAVCMRLCGGPGSSADIHVPSATQGMIFYFPLWIEYVREVFLSSVEDGISYVEPRFMFGVK